MRFEVIGAINEMERIAAGPSLRVRARLRKLYGIGRWRKMKGVATVRFEDGSAYLAEVHWYEAHGIGKRDMKIKYLLDN